MCSILLAESSAVLVSTSCAAFFWLRVQLFWCLHHVQHVHCTPPWAFKTNSVKFGANAPPISGPKQCTKRVGLYPELDNSIRGVTREGHRGLVHPLKKKIKKTLKNCFFRSLYQCSTFNCNKNSILIHISALGLGHHQDRLMIPAVY